MSNGERRGNWLTKEREGSVKLLFLFSFFLTFWREKEENSKEKKVILKRQERERK